MNAQLEKLIKMSITDGEISPEKLEILKTKAKSLGIEEGELMIYIDHLLIKSKYSLQNQLSNLTNKGKEEAAKHIKDTKEIATKHIKDIKEKIGDVDIEKAKSKGLGLFKRLWSNSKTSKVIIVLILIAGLFKLYNNPEVTNNKRGELSFIDFLKENIDFKKCILYCGERYDDLSKEKKKDIKNLHEAITSKGIKIYTPIEVMEYEGNSSELAYTKEDIEGISSVFHELYDEIFEEAKVFIKNDKFEETGVEYYANGNIKSISKSYEGKYVTNSFTYRNFEDGTLMSLYVTADDKYQLIFRKDYDGKLKEKELNIMAKGLPIFAFNERYNKEDTRFFFTLGNGSNNSIFARIDNSNTLTSLTQRVTCYSPEGPNVQGRGKELGVTLIDYRTDSYKGKQISEYWDSGVHYIANTKCDLNNNTCETITWLNEAKQDTSSIQVSKIVNYDQNGRKMIYGDMPLVEFNIKLKQVAWKRENGSKYKYSEEIYDETGNVVETITYHPNGTIKSR